jgi:hypothetical protein
MRKQLLMWCPLLLLTTAAWGQSLCVDGTLAGYESLTSGCTIDGVTFSDFTFSSSGSTAPLPAASGIAVIPDTNTSDPGLEFTGPFAAAAGTDLDALIGFTISAASITSETLAMQGYGQSADGSVQVTESVCEGTLSGSGGCSGPTASLDVFDNASGSVSADTVSFADTPTVEVVKNIIVQGGATGSAGVSVVYNTVPGAVGVVTGSMVPEPDSLITLGSGLVLTALLLRRRIRKV